MQNYPQFQKRKFKPPSDPIFSCNIFKIESEKKFIKQKFDRKRVLKLKVSNIRLSNNFP